MLEYPNGQTLSKPKDKEKKRRESKSLKMMKSQEDKLTPKKKLTNKNLDKHSSTRPTNNSMITKIWLRLFIAKCSSATSPLSNKLRENFSKEKKLLPKKSIPNGKNSKNKKWPSMMKD